MSNSTRRVGLVCPSSDGTEVHARSSAGKKHRRRGQSSGGRDAHSLTAALIVYGRLAGADERAFGEEIWLRFCGLIRMDSDQGSNTTGGITTETLLNTQAK